MPAAPASTRPAIVGVGYTDMVRYAERSLGSLALDAALAAIQDAGLTRDDIDGYVGTPSAPNAAAIHADGVDEVSSEYMVRALGLPEPRWVMDLQAMPAAAIVAASQALAAGACSYVLVLKAMYHPPGVRYAGFKAPTVPGPAQFTVPYGIGDGIGGGGNRHAIWLQRYMHDHGATREELFQVIRAARRHASLNPVAYWRGKDLTLDEYMKGRWIYEPISIYDCDIPVTGAGAVLMTTAERARALPHKPAYVAGYCNAYQQGDAIFGVSGIPRSDVQLLQIYDGYSPFIYHWLEFLGFCGPGEAHSFIQGGRTELGGELPMNTFGGSLGEGRLHGFGHIREAAMQVMGRCGPRQVPGAAHCVVQIGPPGLNSWVLMLSSA